MHVGFLIAAQSLDKDVRSLVASLLEKYKQYNFIVTGHSYGGKYGWMCWVVGIQGKLTSVFQGAVATLIGLMYVDVFKKRKPHVYAFAPPCSLCPALSKSPFARKHITSVVNDDDVVCRLGLSTLIDIRRILYEFHKNKNATDEEKYELYHAIEREHVDMKLFPGGNTWVLDSELYYRKPTLVDQVEELASIQVSIMFIANHLPPSYYKVVHALDKFK